MVDKKETKQESEEIADEPTVYELGYHLLPTIAEENLQSEVAVIKSIIEKNNGTLITEEAPKPMQLAYTIFRGEGGKNKKFDNTYFGWMKFEMEAGNIQAAKEALDEHEQLLRYLLIKTVRESTLAPKKLIFEKPFQKPKITLPPPVKLKPVAKKEEPKQTISDEELDRTIEELVAE